MSTKESKSFGGMAFFDEGNFFMFAPDTRVIGATPRFRTHGVAQQMSDGTFDFVPTRRERSKSELICKLAHGRLSRLKSGATRLTLTIDKEELNKFTTIVLEESGIALSAKDSFDETEKSLNREKRRKQKRTNELSQN